MSVYFAIFILDAVYLSLIHISDRFVAYTRQAAFFAGQSFAVDQSRTADGDVFQTDSPDQGVLPVAVTEDLVFIMFIRFRRVVSFVLSRKGGDDACALFQIEMDVAFQPDGITGIFSGRQIYGTSAFLCGSFDGTVDGGRINRLSVYGLQQHFGMNSSSPLPN